MEAQAPTLSYVVPGIADAGTGDVISLVGSNFGAAGDSVVFPGPVTTGVVAYGAGWVNVVVPPTYSGPVQVKSAASGMLSNEVDLEIRFNWSQSKWNTADLPLTWWLNDQGAPGCTLDQTYDKVQAAYWAWECASDVTTSFQGYTSNLGNSRTDGQNILYWRDTGNDPGTIAVCAWEYDPGTMYITEFDIRFNSQHYTWSCTDAAGDISVQATATHEEGHSIGLYDMYGSADSLKTMYGLGGNGINYQESPSLEDVLGAEFMYPRAGRPNLTAGAPAGWYGPISPRNTSDATETSSPLPTTLDGNVYTFPSFAGVNSGLDCAGVLCSNRFFLDGLDLFNLKLRNEQWQDGDIRVLGLGFPVFVRGGRHSMRLEYDSSDLIFESNETDNTYATQFVFSPYALSNITPVNREAPPGYGTFPAPNCDGFAFTGGWWGAVGLLNQSMTDDYDLYLYSDYTGSLSGFSAIEASSQSMAGETEFVLVNGNNAGFNFTAYAGAVAWDAGAGFDVSIQQGNEMGTTTAPSTYGAEASAGGFVIGNNDVLRVHEFYLSDPSLTYTFTLDNLSGNADLDMAIYPASGTYMNKFDLETGSFDVGDGTDERFNYSPPAPGYYAVVVWKKNAAGYGRTNSYELKVGVALSNLNAQSTAPGWHGPIVPRNAFNATSTSVPLTSVLAGNIPATYLNWSIEQEGPNNVPAWSASLILDGEFYLDAMNLPADNPPQFQYTINQGPYTVRGGRHTLASIADVGSAVTELSESDNTFSDQYVWSPLVLSKNTPQVRMAPPAAGTGVYPNSDGMQFTPGAATTWVVGLASQDPGDDYDLHVYDDYTGSASGFSSELAMSGFGENDVDFVVGPAAISPAPLYPAAVRSILSNGTGLILDQSDAVGREGGEFATFALQILDPDRLVDVYRANLSAGVFYNVSLSIIAGPSDLSVAVMPPVPGAYGRSAALGESVPIPSGGEVAGFIAPYTGTYPLVVFRRQGGGTNPVVKYTLEWGPSEATGLPGNDPAPERFAFLGAHPNPVRGSSVLEFTLPGESEVRMDLFNIQGRKVVDLTGGRFDAGRHALPWNGQDGTGRNLASGVYYLRLESRYGTEVRRVTVLH